MQQIVKLIENYYAAFNRGDFAAMIDCLSEDVAHDINQGAREVGKDRFRQFMKMMDAHYSEKVLDLVVMANESAHRASAEFIIEGVYKATAEGLPPARGQKYRLPVGAFFSVKDGKIARVTNFYNLEDWIKQVK